MVHIRKLREKVEEDPQNPELIRPYGERGIALTKRHRPSRLGLKFLAVAAAALAAALALRALLYDTALPGLLQSAGFESYWYDATAARQRTSRAM